MPNTTVPAAAEGVPPKFLAENRIIELAREISELLDRVPGRDFVLVHAASSEQRHRIIMGGVDGDEFKPDVGISVRDVRKRSFEDLENQICELRTMVAIMDELLDQVFYTAPPQGSTLTIELTRDDIEKYAFAYKNVMRRTIDLKRDFYSAWDD